MPQEYKAQVQGQMWIAEKEWCDFLCYAESIKPLLVRVKRDDDFIKLLEEIVMDAVESINENVNQLKGK